MGVGRRRHPVEIQRESSVSDGMGGWQTGWATIGIEWAAIDSVRGDEFLQAGQLQAATTAKVTIPYRDDLSTADRIVYHGKKYDLKAILPNNTRSEMTCMCEVGLI
ncbi:phage head closure protein [Stutzerimonas stutzeri]|uniref:phage head closure protein n=1 Tax=Stutzerimonas stutzeri TaxID=316 RepID=UPI00210B50BF|nr:phage head closure protein [Stutzerimonas stutzeri]MCQ4322892.1 phage head closure protein [Stutzerimonas stutzeri]